MKAALARLKARFSSSRLGRWSSRLKAERPALWQFAMFNLLSLCATATDLGVFSLLNYWLLTPYRGIGVSWWLLDYSPAEGGLAALIATAAAYIAAQTVNFFVQRKATFKADNSVAASGAAYFVMILGIWVLQIWLSAVLLRVFIPIAGEFWGGILMRLANGMASLLIQFPLNKFVIMKSGK